MIETLEKMFSSVSIGKLEQSVDPILIAQQYWQWGQKNVWIYLFYHITSKVEIFPKVATQRCS